MKNMKKENKIEKKIKELEKEFNEVKQVSVGLENQLKQTLHRLGEIQAQYKILEELKKDYK